MSDFEYGNIEETPKNQVVGKLFPSEEEALRNEVWILRSLYEEALAEKYRLEAVEQDFITHINNLGNFSIVLIRCLRKAERGFADNNLDGKSIMWARNEIKEVLLPFLKKHVHGSGPGAVERFCEGPCEDWVLSKEND